jgi:type IV secretory pathway VirB10-like protein
VTHLSPDPAVSHQARKAPPESVLAAPRNPVTRWNRKYLIAGATGLAGIVALGFYLGFGGAHAPQARPEAMTDAADTGQVQTPAISTKYAAGYADPALQAQAPPGTAALPPAEGSSGALAAGTPPPPPPPAQVDPAVQTAREQALAARTSGPFFGGAPPVGAAAPSADLAALARPIAASTGSAGEPAAAEVQPANGQAAKRQFAANARTDDYLTNPLQPALSPWEVKAGSIISAALVTAINSDLPGQVIAQVTEPVYDHRTGRTVLIPQGSRLIGQYDSQIAYGQNRALIAWNRIIMPDGRSINIGSMAGADLSGAAGLRDKTDGHFGQLARGVILSTLFSVGAAAAQDAGNRSSGALVINSAASGVANSAQQVGQQITGRDLNRQPTLRVRAGWPVRVLVSKDMILAPYP